MIRPAVLLLLACPAAECAQQGPNEPRQALSGCVLDAMRQPVPQARVEVQRPATPGVLGSSVTDGAGRFWIARLPPGQVEIRVCAEGYAPGAATVNLSGPRASEDLEIVLCDAGVVTGAVVDADGKPIAGATVWAAPRLGRTPRPPDVTTSDAQGRFVLRHVPLGQVMLWAHTADLGASRQALLLWDAAERRVVLTRQRLTALEIQVRELVPEAPAVTVHLVPEHGMGGVGVLPPGLASVSLEHGQGLIRFLPAGDFLVRCAAPGLRFEPAEQRIHFDPGGAATLRFDALARRPVQVSGVVREPRGTPLPGHRLGLCASPVASAATTAVATTTTDAEGRFSVSVPAFRGDRITAQALYADLALTGPDAVVRSAELALELTAVEPQSISGRALGTDGRPLANAGIRLTAHLAGTQLNRATCTGPDGSFAFTKLPRSQGTLWLRLDSARGSVEAELQLDGAARVPAVTLQLVATAEAEGTVTDPDGKPVPGARIALRDWALPGQPLLTEGERETFTDRRGRFRFTGVRAGTYRAEVFVDGLAERASEVLELVDGKTGRLAIVLR